MRKYKASHVFVPGGLPSHTYIERAEGAIKNRLESANDNLCKLVTLTGQTKSGKTVITQKVFSELEDQNIWINGGSIETENDIWSQVVEQLGGWTVEEVSEHKSSTHKIHGKGTAEANALVVKGKGEVGGELGGARGTGQKTSREVSPKTSALKLVREHQVCLILDHQVFFKAKSYAAFLCFREGLGSNLPNFLPATCFDDGISLYISFFNSSIKSSSFRFGSSSVTIFRTSSRKHSILIWRIRLPTVHAARLSSMKAC